MPMCKTVDHCYEGGSKTVVDRYHSGNNLGTGPVLFQYYNVYWDTFIMYITGAWAIIKVSGHQHWWLAGGYDLEIGHFQR